jgi:hypothetical protein
MFRKEHARGEADPLSAWRSALNKWSRVLGIERDGRSTSDDCCIALAQNTGHDL